MTSPPGSPHSQSFYSTPRASHLLPQPRLIAGWGFREFFTADLTRWKLFSIRFGRYFFLGLLGKDRRAECWPKKGVNLCLSGLAAKYIEIFPFLDSIWPFGHFPAIPAGECMYLNCQKRHYYYQLPASHTTLHRPLGTSKHVKSCLTALQWRFPKNALSLFSLETVWAREGCYIARSISIVAIQEHRHPTCTVILRVCLFRAASAST